MDCPVKIYSFHLHLSQNTHLYNDHFITVVYALFVASSAYAMWQTLAPDLQARGLQLHMETLSAGLPSDQHCVLCEINPRLFPQQEAYSLSVTQKVVGSQMSGNSNTLSFILGV